MNRRKFIKGAAVAGGATAVAASTFPAPAISAGGKKWNVVSAFGKAGLLGQALEEFAKLVSTASDGKLTIKAYHAGELVKPFEAMDAVQSGAAQMGMVLLTTGQASQIRFPSLPQCLLVSLLKNRTRGFIMVKVSSKQTN